MKYLLTIDQLRVVCSTWQNILRLTNWDIAVCICRKAEFDNPEAAGEIKYQLSSGKAMICLLDSADYADSPFEQDMEKTLVHELLHLYFAPFTPEPGTLADDLMENTIEHIAEALVNLKRNKVRT